LMSEFGDPASILSGVDAFAFFIGHSHGRNAPLLAPSAQLNLSEIYSGWSSTISDHAQN